MLSDVRETQAYEYALAVLNGEIKAGKYIIMACARFMKDIERSESGDLEYFFDFEEYDRLMKFTRLLKYSSGISAGKTVKLAGFQVFIIANLFCWKHKERKTRRFTRGVIQIARKNGKSFLMAIIGLYEMLIEPKAEVISIATKKDQAAILYEEAKLMIQSSPALAKHFKTLRSEIRFDPRNGTFKPLSSDSNSLDGLNISFGILDEFGAHKNYDLYNVIRSSQVARPNGQLVIISTAYFNPATSPLYTERDYMIRVLEEHVTDEEYFCMLYELDNPEEEWQNPDMFVKSNPLLTEVPSLMKFLLEELNAVKAQPSKVGGFRTKNLNIWEIGVENAYLPWKEWKKCEVKEKTDNIDLNGQRVIVGVDLSKTTDLTAVSMMWHDGEKFRTIAHGFLPSSTVEEKSTRDRVNYKLMEQLGYCTITPGLFVDYNLVYDYILNLEEKYNCKIGEIGMDFYNGAYLAQDLTEAGFEVVEIKQNYRSLSPATKAFRERVFTEEVAYYTNDILDFCISSATTKIDPSENEMLDKKESKGRIDLLAATIFAFSRLYKIVEERSPYDDRGILFF